MRDPVENISKLQKQLNDLQLENQILKNVLERAGVSYKQSIARLKVADEGENYEPEQGKRIIHPGEITDKMANNFFLQDFGDVKMFMLREMKRKILEKVIFSNFGKISNLLIYSQIYKNIIERRCL